MTKITNPHDRFFKQMISHGEAARDFICYYLPPEVVRLLDLSTLETSKDSFVDVELRTHFSDLLYKVQLQDGQGAHIGAGLRRGCWILKERPACPRSVVSLGS